MVVARPQPAGAQVMDAEAVGRAVRRIAHEILERHRGVDDVVVIGVHTGGAVLASILAETMTGFERTPVPAGALEISPHRDDRDTRPRVGVGTSEIPVDISDRSVVLVDDVLYTGRTVRAALDALAAIGRASTVELAVLVDRGHRELPIRADYVGKNLPTSRRERVTVRLRPLDDETGVWIERASG